MRYKQVDLRRHKMTPQEKSYKIRIVKRNLIGTGMVILPFLGFLCFTCFPMLLSFLLSFTKLKSALVSEATFLGWGNLWVNYKYVLTDSYTWKAMRTTLVYSLTVFVNLAISIFLANLMNKEVRGKNVLYVLYFLPQVCSSVAVSMMWRWMFADTGVINSILGKLGLERINFFTETRWYMFAILIISIWRSGTNIVVLLSGFTGVNASLQEAGRLDGANERQVFWKITFPQLTPTIFYLLTMNLVAALQEQAIFQLINTTAVGPEFWGLTLTYQMYRLMSVNIEYGLSCAMSWFIGIFILIVTKVNFSLSKK